jgi:hypothetical protein
MSAGMNSVTAHRCAVLRAIGSLERRSCGLADSCVPCGHGRRTNPFRCFRFNFSSAFCKAAISSPLDSLARWRIDHSLQRGRARRKSGETAIKQAIACTGTTLKCGQKRTNVQPGLSLPSRPDQRLTFAAAVQLVPTCRSVSATSDATQDVALKSVLPHFRCKAVTEKLDEFDTLKL